MQIRKDLLEKLIDMASVSVEYLNSKDDDIKWITVKGNHIPIKKGQTEDEAVKAFLSKVESEDSKKVADKTQSKEFKEWFGGSKVVDKEGKPLVVYHGTNAQFDSFDEKLFNKNEKAGDYIGEGFYFTRNESTAKKYGENIMSVHLKIKNPLIINTEEDAKKFRESFGLSEKYGHLGIGKYRDLTPNEIKKEVIKRGYDGLIDNIYGQYAVFKSEQIKIKK